MFYKQQVKHLLELLKTPSAWNIRYEPIYVRAPRTSKLHPTGKQWTVFKLKDSEFEFNYSAWYQMGNTNYMIRFPPSYNIELTWWEKRAIVKAVKRIFKIAQQEDEQEKRVHFLKSLLK